MTDAKLADIGGSMSNEQVEQKSGSPLSPEMAREIARRWNAHDDLVAALKGLVALCGRTGYHPTDECKAAEAALEKADHL